MLETSPYSVHEPHEMWYWQMEGMAMGKYPQGVLAHRSSPHTYTCYIQ